MQFTWRIVAKGDKVMVSNKDKTKERPKQDVVIEDTTSNSEYPDVWCFTIFGDRNADLFKTIKEYKVGQSIEIEYNMNTRIPETIDKNTRFFTNLNIWRINAQEKTDLPDTSDNASDDLPF